MQRFPIGEQSFRNLREENKIYVDKTRQIYDLLHTGKFVFLARPRRFGKSLLTTTLQELFRGNQALFQDLWIEDKIDWQPHPVILLNFNDLDYLTTGPALYDEPARYAGVDRPLVQRLFVGWRQPGLCAFLNLGLSGAADLCQSLVFDGHAHVSRKIAAQAADPSL